MTTQISGTQVWRGREELRHGAAALDAALADTSAEVSARWPAIDVWTSRHPESEPWFVGIQDDGRWTAVAVVMVKVRHGVAVIVDATEPGTFTAITALDERAGAQLADALVTEISRVHRLWAVRLGMLTDQSPAAAALAERVRLGRVGSRGGAPRLMFEPGSDSRQYLSRNTRSTVARSMNRLRSADLHLELSWLTDPDEVGRMLPLVLDVHRRRNRQLRGQSILDDPAEAKYFTDMVTAHAEAGRLELLAAMVGDQLAAFAVCFTAKSTWWVYANLVSPEWTDFSVGTIANAEVVRRSHDRHDVKCLDWGAGRQRYKLSGGAEVVNTHQFQGWSSWPVRAASTVTELDPLGRLGRMLGGSG